MKVSYKLKEEEIEKEYCKKDKRKKIGMKVTGAGVKRLQKIIHRRGLV